jgi:hypothetical protein
MRPSAVGAMVGAVALAGIAPAIADARVRQLDTVLRVTGAVTITWHGDRARGCERAGLCGYRGSLSVRPTPAGELVLSLSHRRVSDGYGYVDLTRSDVIRVRRDEAGQPSGGCVDIAATGQLPIGVSAGAPGRVRLALAGAGLSPGRCAGPALDRALRRLPGDVLALGRLRRPGTTIDLRGRASFVSGRFSGTVVSTLRARTVRAGGEFAQTIGFARRARLAVRSARRAHSMRFVLIEARYRVTGLSGELATAFQGPPGAECLVLDACGVSGSTTWGVLARGGSVVLTAFAPARASDRGLRDAIRDFERGGIGLSYGRVRHAVGATTAEVLRSGGATCRDSEPAAAPVLGSIELSGGIKVSLGGANIEAGTGDWVRTGCPGPTQADVLGSSDLASAVVPASALARRRLDLILRGRSTFGASGYSGSRRSQFVLALRRTRLTVSYGGQSVLP